MQLVLLVVGVSALSVGAIFFLVYAFINFGIAWRSVIIGAITVAAFACASVLRRLRATAEGVAAFAVVLVYLDAFAVRANEFFGAAAVDGNLFWGTTLVLSAAVFVLWHRLSGLRVPSIAGFITFAPGIGLIVDAAASDTSDSLRAWLVCSAVSLGGVLHRLAWRGASADRPAFAGRTERAIVLGTSILALAAGFFVAFTVESRESDATASVLALLGVAAVAAAHLVVLRSFATAPPGARSYAFAFGALLGVALASTGIAVAMHDSNRSLVVIVPSVIAATVALVLESGARRIPDRLLKSSSAVAAWSAFAIAAVTILIPIGFAVVVVAMVLAGSLLSPWSLAANDIVAQYTDEFGLAILALAIIGLLATFVWKWNGIIRQRAAYLGWFGAAVLILATPLLSSLALIFGGWLVLATASLTTLVATRSRRGVIDVVRAPLYGVLATATLFSWSVGWANTSTWAIAAGATIALLLATRIVANAPTIRAALLGASSILLLIAAATTARRLTFPGDPNFLSWTADSLRFAELAAVVLAGVAALSSGRIASALDRRTVFWIAIITAGACTAWLRLSPVGTGGTLGPNTGVSLLPQVGTTLAIDALLLVVLMLWLALRGTAKFLSERMVSSVALAPAVYLVLDSFSSALALSESARSIAPIVAALIVSGASFAVAVSRPPTTHKLFREIGIGLVAVPATFGAIARSDDATWLVLLLAAFTAILLSAGQHWPSVSAALLGIGTILLIGSAADGAGQLVSPAGEMSTAADSIRLAGIVAVVLLGLSAWPLRSLPQTFAGGPSTVGPSSNDSRLRGGVRAMSALDRRTVFWISFVVGGASAAWLRFGLTDATKLLPEFGTSLVVDALLLVGLLLWASLRNNADFRFERIASSLALGPAVYLVVDSFTRVLDLQESARSLAPITAALLTSAGALAVTLIRAPEQERSRMRRSVREIGVALVAVPAVLGAIASAGNATWLVLLIASVTALLVGISSDGLFASESKRRHFGWLALALAIGGLWWRLGDGQVNAVEPYVLPLAGALLIIALLIWSAARGATAIAGEAAAMPAGTTAIPGGAATGSAPTSSLAAPVIAFAGLLVAILPISAYASTGQSLRALLIAAASAALLLLGSIVVGSSGIRPYLDAAALAGAIGVVVTSVGRGTFLVLDRADGFELDAWLGFALLVLVIAGFGLTRQRPDAFQRQRLLAGQALALIGLTATIALESVAISGDGVDGRESGLLRAFAVTLVFSAIHVISFLIDRVPFTRLVAWLALAYAAIAALIGIRVDTLDPIESGTVPIALALLATGTMHLAAQRDARSWPWLGPGVTVLLLPSLVATIEDRPVWRLVAIGVVGIAILIVGVVRRLQAPFLIAGAVVLIHAFATFAPQVRAAYQFLPWWLWLAFGGVILIVLAARYEQRMHNLRETVLKISSLR